jgi:hypothetical protein
MRSSVGQSRGSQPTTSRQLRCIHSTESLIVLISSQGKTMPLFKMLRLIIQEVTLLLREELISDFLEELAQFWLTAQPSHLSPRSSKTISQAKLRTMRETMRKEKYYQRLLDIKTTDQCAIFFFAVETSGGLGREEIMKMLAKLSGGPMGFTIMRIYQTLVVEVQTARANQVYFTKNCGECPTQPWVTSGTLL